MAATPSKMIALGSTIPSFSLPDVRTGKKTNFPPQPLPKATLVMFICNHCPFVQHVVDELVKIGGEYMPRGVGIYAISSNDVDAYPQDAPDKMADLARQRRFPFPYLYDDDQSVARAFDAACTPDFFVYDGEGRLAYRGQLDDSRPGNNVPVTGRDLRAALDALLRGETVKPQQKPSIGCNIKWKERAS